MKIVDKLTYKIDTYFGGDDFEEHDVDAYYFNKSYEIIDIFDDRCYFIDEVGDRDFFKIHENESDYYIWDYFYTKEEIRLKKLNSL